MRHWLRRRRAELVIVHTIDEKSVRGMLRDAAAEGVLLAAPELLLADTTVPLGGELWVPRDNVRFIQLNVGSGK